MHSVVFLGSPAAALPSLRALAKLIRKDLYICDRFGKTFLACTIFAIHIIGSIYRSDN